MLFSLNAQAQPKGYSVTINSGISSLGDYDAGLFVYHQGKPGLLGLNYLPQAGVSVGAYKQLSTRPKSKFDLGLLAYYSRIELQYQVVSSMEVREFEPFKSSSQLNFGYYGPSFRYTHKIKDSKWNYEAGLDALFLGLSGLTSPQFDSLNNIGISSLSGKPNLPRLLVMPSFGITYSMKNIDLGIHLSQSLNTFLTASTFHGKQLMYLNLGAKFRF